MFTHLLNLIRGVFKTFSVMATVGVVLGVAVVFFFFFNLFRGLPDVSSLKDFQHSVATEVFSDDGRKIGEFTTERRYPVQFEKIPLHVIRAFMAAEDSKFYEHGGVDFVGILRAIVSNLVKGRYAQGGSTITQQVARSLLLATRKKELTRKIREMILAFRMEKTLSKNEILNLYLSEIYLGHGAFGIGAASRNYFNKNVEDLNVAEASMLAGLPQRPNEWDPFRNPATCKKRQTYVLRRMVDEKYLTEQQAQEASQVPLKLYRLEELNSKAAPYFTEYVRQYLMDKYGSENVLSQGFKVYTTVRYDFQKSAEKSLDKGLRSVDKRLGFRGVTQKLDSQQKIDAFLNTTHEEVLDKLINVRILPPTIEANEKKLQYDLSVVQHPNSPYFGPTPVAENEYYKAVISEVHDKEKEMIARVGQTTVVLPLASVNWVKVGDRSIRILSQVFHPGDVISVKIDKIDRLVSRVTASLEQEPEIQGALLSYEIQTGFVRAMVGGTDFAKSQFNRALHAKRQVGSTFKPLIYAAAIDKGFSPSSIVTDSPIVFKYEGSLDADAQGEEWKPHNYGERFEGELPLRLALIRSMNIPTVKVLNEIGVDYGIQYARTLGITAVLPRDLTIALGSWSSSLEEIMRAYAIFPRLGKPVVLNYIKKVLDGNGKVLEELPAGKTDALGKHIEDANSGQALAAQGEPQQVEQVISPQTAYVMTDMLKGVIREGTGRGANVYGGHVAGKTGTSNDHRDAWFVGYSPHVMAGVWIGFDKEKPLDLGETGGRAAAPIWAEYMSSTVKAYPSNEFSIPDDIVFAYVDRESGRLASSQSTNRVRVAFKVGSVPTTVGDNLPRIGEPGSRVMSTEPVATDPGAPKGVQATPPKQAPATEDTSDALRQGYQ